jgi:Tol biopolymer transport system component
LVDEAPDWSRDSTTIYFHRVLPSVAGPPGLYKISARGGQETFVSAGDYLWPDDIRVSPDSRFVVGTWSGEIRVVDLVQGTQSSNLVSSVSAFEPDWSPDGKNIVYARNFDPNGGLWIYNLSTASDTALQSNGRPAFGRHPHWSPDGVDIAYSSGYNIYLQSSSGGPIRTLATPIRGGYVDDPIWLDNSRLLFMEVDSKGLDYNYTVRRDGTGRQLLPGWGNLSEAIDPTRTKGVVLDRQHVAPDTDYVLLFTRSLSDPTLRQLTHYSPP